MLHVILISDPADYSRRILAPILQLREFSNSITSRDLCYNDILKLDQNNIVFQ